MSRLRLLAAGLLLASIAACFFLWPSEGSDSTHPSPPGLRELAGVDLSYPHTPTGAALAAAAYQQAFADPHILRPSVLRARIEAVATPRFAPTMLAANAPGAARLARGALGRGLAAGLPSVFYAVPVGYRLISYSPTRARVLTWGLTLLGNSTSLEPTAYFGTARTELAWIAGQWKIASTRSALGPTPRLASPRKGGEGFGLIGLTQELRPYGLTP